MVEGVTVVVGVAAAAGYLANWIGVPRRVEIGEDTQESLVQRCRGMVVRGGENSRRRGLVAVGLASRGGEEEVMVGAAIARIRIEGGQELEGRDWGLGMAIFLFTLRFLWCRSLLPWPVAGLFLKLCWDDAVSLAVAS